VTDEQKAAYIISMAVSALIEAMGMHAHNMHQQALGESEMYPEEAFTKLIEKHGIHHNGVLTLFLDEREQKDERIENLEAALPDPDKLELLAKWFDKEQREQAGRWVGVEVQDDIRAWAEGIRKALAEGGRE
jgi:hypothetical protein